MPEVRRLILAMSGPESERQFQGGVVTVETSPPGHRCPLPGSKTSALAQGSLASQTHLDGACPCCCCRSGTNRCPVGIDQAAVPQEPPAGRPYHEHRRVVSGILWVMRTSSSWREMPEEYGKWETAYRRYRLWLEQGLWERILQALGEEGLPGPTTKES